MHLRKDEPKKVAPQSLAVSAHSEAFNISVDAMLKSYFAMTENIKNRRATAADSLR